MGRRPTPRTLRPCSADARDLLHRKAKPRLDQPGRDLRGQRVRVCRSRRLDIELAQHLDRETDILSLRQP